MSVYVNICKNIFFACCLAFGKNTIKLFKKNTSVLYSKLTQIYRMSKLSLCVIRHSLHTMKGKQ